MNRTRVGATILTVVIMGVVPLVILAALLVLAGVPLAAIGGYWVPAAVYLLITAAFGWRHSGRPSR